MIDNEQLSSLVGKSVETLCFTEFAVYIHFEGEILLTIENEFEVLNIESNHRTAVRFPLAGSESINLFQCLVISAVLDENNYLKVGFSNGSVLGVHRQLEYEAFRLKIGEKEFFA